MAFNRPMPDRKSPRDSSDGMGALVEAEKMIQIAILLPAAAFIGWLAGAWLDKRLHQSWIAFAGIIFGGIAGLIHVVRLALAAEKKSPPADPTEPGDSDKQA